MVSFSALTPGLGPCFIHIVMVNWSVRFLGTMPSGILAPCLPSNLKIISLLSTSSPAVQLVAALGDGKRSMMPDDAPAEGRDTSMTVMPWGGREVSVPSAFCFWVRMELASLLRSVPTPDLGGSEKSPVSFEPLT